MIAVGMDVEQAQDLIWPFATLDDSAAHQGLRVVRGRVEAGEGEGEF